MQNFLACDAWLVGEEGRVADEHFKQNGTARPPIDSLVVALLAEYFWGDVVGRADS